MSIELNIAVKTQDKNDPAYWLREHGPKLLAYARQWAGDHATAEDVLQEAFVNFWRNRDSVRHPLTYLYRCVRNTAMNQRRSRDRRQRYEGQARPGREADGPDTAAEQSERHASIRQAVAELPRTQREVVVMKVWGELTFGQIGKVMSIARSTAHAVYRTAMTALHRQLGEEI